MAMAGRRKRPPATGNGCSGADGAAADASAEGYERSRDRRIRENKERMQKLGLFDLSLKLKSDAVASRKNRPRSSGDSSEKRKPPVLAPPGSPRRSSRLKTLVPVSYVEYRATGKRESPEDFEIRIKEGSKPEIYTEEHERALGDSKAAWTLLIDGYGEDGKRIYDNVNGETCHQCRQKTLGMHTHCVKCNMVQGQFCADCLYMRYGENVIEANQTLDWICPVCRDICNCSLCRKAKGWMPTGLIYRKVAKLGYKSVAHYLIQTNSSKVKEINSGAEVQPAEKPTLLKESFPQDEYHLTGEETEDLMYGGEDEEDEKVKLLDNDHVDASSEVDKDAEDAIETDGILSK